MSSATIFQEALRRTMGNPLFVPAIWGSIALAAWKYELQVVARDFVTGPGRVTRILLLFSVLLNWKMLPFGWTYRILSTYYKHFFRGQHTQLGPEALFKPIISSSRVPPLEIDYNMHKSNSTFFSDADVTRAHCICYLVRPGWYAVNRNAKTRLVLDPKTGEPMKGTISIVLGAVECSFRREISMFEKYEMWTTILSWDRKWIYTATYFVRAGTSKPTHWLHPEAKKLKTRTAKDATGGWERNILATSCAKYVFKLGRFTVHPSIVLEASGLLPERPGGWRSGEDEMGDATQDVSDVDLSKEGEWDWRRVEACRRQGLEYGAQLSGLDELKQLFDGGSQGAVAHWGPG